jgi:transposase-like protein
MEDYLVMQIAVETVLLSPKQSVNSIARTYGVPQSSLDRIYKDQERRDLYLSGDTDDDRISTAIAEKGPQTSRLSELEESLEELEAKVAVDE